MIPTARENENVVEIQRLTVRYGDFTAVDDVSFSVRRGDVFGFLGPNGAGKTTTIKVLTGQKLPSGGTALVAGFDAVSQLGQIKSLFGYVPDVDNHFDELTAAQNLELFCSFYGIACDRINECLSAVELFEERDIRVRAFSKGMKKKLLIARALLHEPVIWFMDEPTANLDVHSTRVVRELIRSHASEGRTVFLTTHNMKEVEEVCDRVAILNHGRLIDVNTPAALTARSMRRQVDVLYETGGTNQRASFDLDATDDRGRLAELVNSGQIVRMRSRDVDFQEAFLRLTGQRDP